MGGPGGVLGVFFCFFSKKFFFKFWGALGGLFLFFFFKFFFSFGGPLGDLVGLFLLFHHFGWKIFHQFGSKNILSDLGFLKKVLDCGRSVANLPHDWTTSEDQAWFEIFLTIQIFSNETCWIVANQLQILHMKVPTVKFNIPPLAALGGGVNK